MSGAEKEGRVKKSLDKMMWRLRRGEIDFGAFVVGTRADYAALAAYLLRRWPGPTWFSQEDLEQELYLGTWAHVWGYTRADGSREDYDPSRGVTLSRWVVFGSVCAAKRALHKARGASLSGSPDRNPSRREVPASALGERGAALFESLLAERPTAEAELIRREDSRETIAAVLETCRPGKERVAVLAIREAGSLDGAARLLYDDFGHRVTLRLGSEEAALAFVSRSAAAAARRQIDLT